MPSKTLQVLFIRLQYFKAVFSLQEPYKKFQMVYITCTWMKLYEKSDIIELRDKDYEGRSLQWKMYNLSCYKLMKPEKKIQPELFQVSLYNCLEVVNISLRWSTVCTPSYVLNRFITSTMYLGTEMLQKLKLETILLEDLRCGNLFT